MSIWQRLKLWLPVRRSTMWRILDDMREHHEINRMIREDRHRAEVCKIHGRYQLSDGTVVGADKLQRDVARIAQPCCYDCGRLYGDEFGFPDLVVPNDVWRKIAPLADPGGLLCPSCICRRLLLAEIKTTAKFTSGPLADPSDSPA